MAILDVSGLWQMYTFCAIFLLRSLFMFIIDPCLLITGKTICNSGAELYTSRIMAVGLLYVGTYFLALTYINKDNRPKLKTLANMGLSCALLLIVSIIFIGSARQGGFENSILHVIDLLTGFILLGIMISAIVDESNFAIPNSPLTGLGMNSKTFILIIGLLTFVKFFMLSEFIHLSYFLADLESITRFSHALWQFDIVIILMILFPLSFALVYGDEQDQDYISGLTVFMMAVTEISIMPIIDCLKVGLMSISLISLGVVTLLALTAIYIGKSSRRQAYESVSEAA